MNYREDILELFMAAFERDKPMYIQDWMTSWAYQDKHKYEKDLTGKDAFYDFEAFNGPQDLAAWMDWGKLPRPNYFPESILEPLIERSLQFDKRVIKTHNIEFNFDGYLEGIAKNNAQDYILANAYPMAGPTYARRVLDFGSGSGRQATLWNQMEDEGLVFISVDGIPKSYCVQHFKYSNFDRPFYEYVVDDSAFKLDDNSRGIYHLPTWRLDLIPDNYLDRILAVQVLKELSEELVTHVCEQFRRVLKPTGALYIRDHKNIWNPVSDLDIDQYLLEHGFTKEFEPHVIDRVEFHGLPRIFRKTNPEVLEVERNKR